MFEFFDKKGFKDVVFVSDCAIVSTDSLSKLAGKQIQFISRLPETFTLAQELKDLAWQTSNWNEIGPLRDARKAANYKTLVLSAGSLTTGNMIL